MRPARITGGSQDESEHPRLTEFVTLASAEAERSVFDSAWEAIQNHRIALAVDDVFNFTDQVSQPAQEKAGTRKPRAVLIDRTFRRPQRCA